MFSWCGDLIFESPRFKSRTPDWFGVHVAAYNALSAVVIKTQSKETIFTSLLFADGQIEGKQQILWEHLVDLSQPLDLKVETHFRFHDASMRNLAQERKKLESQCGDPSKYITTQYMADSSLSQHVVDEEIPHAADSMDEFADDEKHEAPGVPVPISVLTKSTIPPESVEVELDCWNQNMALTNILVVLDHMQSQFQASWSTSSIPPPFAQHMLDALRSPVLAEHVKWFLVKIIIRKAKLFEPWATHFFPVLAALFSGDKGFHYMLRDLAKTFLLDWSTLDLQDVVLQTEGNNLIKFLVAHVCDAHTASTPEIVASNIKFIAQFVSRWGQHFAFNKKHVLTLLKSDIKDNKSGKLMYHTGADLLAIFADPAHSRVWDTFVVYMSS